MLTAANRYRPIPLPLTRQKQKSASGWFSLLFWLLIVIKLYTPGFIYPAIRITASHEFANLISDVFLIIPKDIHGANFHGFH